jgi:hypothetical protein
MPEGCTGDVFGLSIGDVKRGNDTGDAARPSLGPSIPPLHTKGCDFNFFNIQSHGMQSMLSGMVASGLTRGAGPQLKQWTAVLAGQATSTHWHTAHWPGGTTTRSREGAQRRLVDDSGPGTSSGTSQCITSADPRNIILSRGTGHTASTSPQRTPEAWICPGVAKHPAGPTVALELAVVACSRRCGSQEGRQGENAGHKQNRCTHGGRAASSRARRSSGWNPAPRLSSLCC